MISGLRLEGYPAGDVMDEFRSVVSVRGRRRSDYPVPICCGMGYRENMSVIGRLTRDRHGMCTRERRSRPKKRPNSDWLARLSRLEASVLLLLFLRS